MNEKMKSKPQKPETAFSQQVGEKAARKLKAQQQVAQTVWSGLGMIGLVGWSVVVPTLLGGVLGNWVDKQYPGSHSFTLMFLAIGLGLGCLNAWHWVAREDRDIHKQENDHHE
ncbi:MAG: ATP synthase protein I [Motiliproteus sp.]|jgi:ATP synthase protein I